MLKRLTAGGTILMIALEIPSPSYAQTASQITPPSFAPPPPQVDAPIVIPQGLGAQAPAGAEAIEVHLGDVIVERAAVDPGALGELREKLVGHPIKLTEVFAAARALEADFARVFAPRPPRGGGLPPPWPSADARHRTGAEPR